MKKNTRERLEKKGQREKEEGKNGKNLQSSNCLIEQLPIEQLPIEQLPIEGFKSEFSLLRH